MKFLIFTLLQILFWSCMSLGQTAVSVSTISETPLEGTYANADTGSGNSIVNKNGDVILHFKNPGASSATATVTAQKTSQVIKGFGALTKSDITCNLSAGEECFVGPLNSKFWNDANGLVQVTYGGSGSGDVDILPFRAPSP